MNHQREGSYWVWLLLSAVLLFCQGFVSLPPDILSQEPTPTPEILPTEMPDQDIISPPPDILSQEPTPTPELLPTEIPSQPVSNGTDTDQVFRWVLSLWKNNRVKCNIYLEKTGEPTHPQIIESCGEDILNDWKNTPPCLKKETTKCTGLYLSFVGITTPEEVKQVKPKPKINVKVSTVNCPAWGTCEENPKLAFTVENDFKPEKDKSLAVKIGKDVTYCEETSCTLDMPITKAKGKSVKYWVETKDHEKLYEHAFKIRNLPLEDGSSTHLVQILGQQWEGAVDACANIWDDFPDIENERDSWLARENSTDFLNTSVDYALLAGKLIWHDYVDASGCEDNGLLPNGAANACGQEQAHDLVVEWQNRLDPVILTAANRTFIPPRLLKGVIAQETQFWPDWTEKNEFGYGMITENGIDMLLTWNSDYYLDLCERHYTPDVCESGYHSLSDQQRQFLRGISMLAVGADEEFTLLANMLKASCMQTHIIVENITGNEPNKTFINEYMWRLSLGVYHAGVGCMGEALDNAWSDYGKAMTWEDFVEHLPEGCEYAADYFDKAVRFGTQ